MDISIRKGKQEDIPELFRLIRELAAFENATAEVTLTVEELSSAFSDAEKAFDFFVAEQNNKILGIALFYDTFSTWKGKSMHLEDLIVEQKHRHQGVGKALLQQVINEADRKNVNRLSWQVLDWNKNALTFFQKYMPVVEENWNWCMLDQNQIKELTLHS